MSTEPSSPLPSPPPSRSTASIVRQRVGVGLVVLGSAVAFGSLFLQWSHDCPTLPSTISCDPSHWGPPDSGPLVPLPPGNPYALPPAWLPFVLPFPLLGLVVALLLLAAGHGVAARGGRRGRAGQHLWTVQHSRYSQGDADE